MMRSRSRWNAGRTSSSGFGTQASARVGALGRLRREHLALARFELFPEGHGRRPDVDQMLTASQEARAVRERSDAEDLGQRLPEVGEGRSRSEIDCRGQRARR